MLGVQCRTFCVPLRLLALVWYCDFECFWVTPDHVSFVAGGSFTLPVVWYSGNWHSLPALCQGAYTFIGAAHILYLDYMRGSRLLVILLRPLWRSGLGTV